MLFFRNDKIKSIIHLKYKDDTRSESADIINIVSLIYIIRSDYNQNYDHLHQKPSSQLWSDNQGALTVHDNQTQN